MHHLRPTLSAALLALHLSCATLVFATDCHAFGASADLDGNGGFNSGFDFEGRRPHGREHTKQKGGNNTQENSLQAVQSFLQKYDLEGKGRISKEQFLMAWGMRYREFDPKDSGSISPEVFSRHLRPQDLEKAPRWFSALDTNRDGSISKAEFEAAGKRLFERLDYDASGILTKEKLLLGLSPNDAANL